VLEHDQRAGRAFVAFQSHGRSPACGDGTRLWHVRDFRIECPLTRKCRPISHLLTRTCPASRLEQARAGDFLRRIRTISAQEGINISCL
jgi:hypothetical protein